MAATCSKLSILISILLFVTLLHQSSSHSNDPSISSHRSLLGIQRNRNQIPRCSEMVSRSQCSQKPKCRWCKSEDLDDMCFTKAEAWRLPRQVFVCDN